MPNSLPIAVAATRNLETKAAPITPSWIIAGNPFARSAMLSQSPDKQAVTMYWECTSGAFYWYFGSDETVYIVEGSVTVTWNGEHTTLNAGDTCFFPAGTVATWTVHKLVRKIAFIRQPPPTLVTLFMRGWHRLMRMLWPKQQMGGQSGLNPATE